MTAKEFTKAWCDLFAARRRAVRACDWKKVGRIDDKLDALTAARNGVGDG